MPPPIEDEHELALALVPVDLKAPPAIGSLDLGQHLREKLKGLVPGREGEHRCLVVGVGGVEEVDHVGGLWALVGPQGRVAHGGEADVDTSPLHCLPGVV